MEEDLKNRLVEMTYDELVNIALDKNVPTGSKDEIIEKFLQ